MGKYYKPEIDEFCIGFEYERIDYRDNSYFKEVVESSVCDKEGLVLVIPDEGKKPRVKYLDKEDVESLGWIYDINESKEAYESFYIEPGQDQKSRFIQYILHNYSNGKVFLYKIIDYGQNEIGMLNIKNKSELIKLMKQLNITP